MAFSGDHPDGEMNVSNFTVNQQHHDIYFILDQHDSLTDQQKNTITSSSVWIKNQCGVLGGWQANTQMTAKNTCQHCSIWANLAFYGLTAMYLWSHIKTECFPQTRTGKKYDSLKKLEENLLIWKRLKIQRAVQTVCSLDFYATVLRNIFFYEQHRKNKSNKIRILKHMLTGIYLWRTEGLRESNISITLFRRTTTNRPLSCHWHSV